MTDAIFHRLIKQLCASTIFVSTRALKDGEIRLYSKDAGHYSVHIISTRLLDRFAYRYNICFSGHRVAIAMSQGGLRLVHGDEHALTLAALL
jgi:hypothetical protein